MSVGRVPGPKFAGPGTTANKYLSIGMARSGLTDFWSYFDDGAWGGAAGFGWTTVAAGTGALDTASFGRNCFGLSTGATAASSYMLRQNSAGNMFLNDSNTDRFYYASRFKITTAVTAQTTAYGGIWDTGLAKTIGIGVFGAGSAANFVLQHSTAGGGVETGTFTSTGVAIDTNFHVFEVWGQGTTTLFCCIDNGVVTSVVTTQTLAAGAMTLGVIRNGTDAVTRSMAIDWAIWMGPRS